MNRWTILPISAVVLGGIIALAETPKPVDKNHTSDPAQAIFAESANAATDFLASLDDAQRAKAVFKLEDEERLNWHFIPKERLGLMLKDLRDDQEPLAFSLLSTCLSHEGFRKATQIMSLEQILFELENKSPKRDPGKYHISIFGTPAAKGTWGWRFEGHHMSFNITFFEGKHLSFTPSFLGANPGVVKDGPRKGLEVLGREDDLGFQLWNALSDEQKKIALAAEKAPDDVLTSANREAKPLEPAGLTADKMDDTQRAILTTLIREHVARHRTENAAACEKVFFADPAKLGFAWAGGSEPGQGHYYRIQCPKYLIEFDNTQNEARHPHAVWRDFNGDFGRDLLKDHLQEAHGK